MEHKYYQATLIVKGDKLPYYWLHFKKQDDYFFNKIDFEKSSFYVGNLARWKQSELNIASTEDYYRIRKSIGFKTINFESVSISKVEEDLFYIDQMHNDFLISNELAKTLQALKISGLEVSEPKFLVNITL